MRPTRLNTSVWCLRARVLAGAAVLLCLGGCSLISLKSPERPLSDRDLNARILTREFSSHFIATIEQCANEISAKANDPHVQMNALRWKIAASAQSQRAATRTSPMMSLLDTWALAAQMKSFLSPGNAGSAVFGTQQKRAVIVAAELDGTAEALARRLIAPDELPQYEQFVERYTRENPVETLDLVRAPVVELWIQQAGTDVRLIDSAGTIPQAMADISDRLQIYNETLPSQTLWKTQLAFQESGYSGSDVRSALQLLDDRLARMSEVADGAPQLVHGAVADVRQSVIDVLARLDASSMRMIVALRAERVALSANVAAEREAMFAGADNERKAIAQDAAKIADQVVKSSGEQMRHLAREVLLLLIVLAIVMLGLPFAAGYLMGRARHSYLSPPNPTTKPAQGPR